MNLSEKLSAEVRAELKGLTFSQTLDEYLALRAAGPDENDGHTDKGFYYRLEALRERMDLMTKQLEE